MKLSTYLKFLLLSIICILPIHASAQALAGTYSVGAGESITVTLSDGCIGTLNMSTVIGSYWIASNSGISILSKSDTRCTIKGLSIGQTRLNYKCTYCIDGYYRDFNFYFEINVTPTYVSSVSVTPSTAQIYPGETLKLSAQVYPSNASNKSVRWTTENSDIATVNSSGLVTGVTSGVTNIWATAIDGTDYCAKSTITVKETTKVETIELAQTSLTMEVGETEQIEATITPNDAYNKKLTYTSLDNDIATVNNIGLITAKSPGTTTVLVSSTDGSNVSTSCQIYVKQNITELTLDKEHLTIDVGKTQKLIPHIIPENATNKQLNWTSSNPNIADVDANGLVTAKSKGTTIISVNTTDGSDLSATCQVDVVRYISSISLSNDSIILSKGEFTPLTATVYPEDASNRTLEWIVTNDIITIENGLVFAFADGEADIIVSGVDGSSVSDTCHVKVRTLVNDIQLSAKKLCLQEGTFIELEATVLPHDATNKKLVWKSSDPNVATFNNGYVVGLSAGNATITAFATDGSDVQAQCIVSIVDKYSGINNTIDDGNLVVKVYSMTGVLIYEGEYKDAKLAKGSYIIISKSGISKHIMGN